MPKLKLIASFLTFATMLCACACPSVRLVKPPKMQADPLPAQLSTKDVPNLQKLLLNSWSISLPEATKASVSTPK